MFVIGDFLFRSFLCFLLVVTGLHWSYAQDQSFVNGSMSFKGPTGIEVSYDCLITDFAAQLAFAAHKGEVMAVMMAPEEVSAEEENEAGKEFYEKEIKEHSFISDDIRLDKLNTIMNRLLRVRENPSELKYQIHLIESEQINAYTFGGHIYVYTGIVEYCMTESELAGVIAHEIGHNEHGHINLTLKRIKNAGELGGILNAVKNMAAPSFNQFNELDADTYGVDLLVAAGYDAMDCANMWLRMAEDNEEQPSYFDKLFRTHPFSMDRYECLKKYIENNY